MKQFSGGCLMIKYISIYGLRVLLPLGMSFVSFKGFYVHNVLIMSIKMLNLFCK